MPLPRSPLRTLAMPALLLGLGLGLAAPALAAGSSDGSATESATASLFQEAKATVDAGNYAAALPMLVNITKIDPQNADAWNLLGFSYRKLEQFSDAEVAYQKVLAINPDHLGGLEYQGELFLQTGRPDEAKANLDRLKTLCGTCEEYEDLAKALAEAGA